MFICIYICVCVYYILVSRYICIYIFNILFRKFNVCFGACPGRRSFPRLTCLPCSHQWCYSHAIHYLKMKLRFNRRRIEFADNTLTISNMDIALIIKMHISSSGVIPSIEDSSIKYIYITNEECMYYIYT